MGKNKRSEDSDIKDLKFLWREDIIITQEVEFPERMLVFTSLGFGSPVITEWGYFYFTQSKVVNRLINEFEFSGYTDRAGEFFKLRYSYKQRIGFLELFSKIE
ncbi:MAG: hypothetical protein AAGF07_01635 [Patescibacteria group bacterium]